MNVFCANGSNINAMEIALNCGVWASRNLGHAPSKNLIKKGAGSLLIVKGSDKDKHKFIWGVIESVEDIIKDDSPWGILVRGNIKVIWSCNSILNLGDFGLNMDYFKSFRSGQPKQNHKHGKTLENLLLKKDESNNLVSSNSIKTLADIDHIFPYRNEKELIGEFGSDGNTFFGKKGRQSGGTEILASEAFYDIYIDPHPVNVVVIFCGTNEGHRLQWLHELKTYRSRLPKEEREKLQITMITDFDEKRWDKQGKPPIFILSDYHNHTRVGKIRRALNYCEVTCTLILDEMQKTLILNTNELTISNKKGGDIHKELDELIRREWGKIDIKRCILGSATTLSGGFKEHNSSEQPSYWVYKNTKTVAEGGSYVYISDLIHHDRDTNYFTDLGRTNFTSEHEEDFCTLIPNKAERNNIFIVTVGTSNLDPQKDLAMALKETRENIGILGSYYGTYNGKHGFSIYNADETLFFTIRGVSFKEAMSQLDKKISPLAPVIIVSDILMGINTQIKNIEGTRTIGGQWVFATESSIENLGLENKGHILRAEGYHKDSKGDIFIPFLVAKKQFVDDVITYDKEMENFHRDKIENPNTSIIGRTFSHPNLIRKEQHLDQKKVVKPSYSTDNSINVISHLIELYTDLPQLEASEKNQIKCVKITQEFFNKVHNYCDPITGNTLHQMGKTRSDMKEENGESTQRYLTQKFRKLSEEYLEYLPGSIRFIEGDPHTKAKGGGNDVSVYINVDFTKIWSGKKSENEKEITSAKDRDKDGLYWINGNSIYLRVHKRGESENYHGRIHAFDGVLKDFSINTGDVEVEYVPKQGMGM